MKLPHVSVLMSSYNGEKYIDEQIDSILCQKDVEVELMIRDDGSSDNTISICQKYANRYSNIKFYKGKNIGVGKSFMELLMKSITSDYYSFADQDDVWMDDKLKRAIEKIEAATKNEIKPTLYTSNQTLVDEKLIPYGMRFSGEPRHDLLQEVSANKISGCTMVLNKKLRDILIDSNYLPNDYFLNTRLHDTWIMLVANIMGSVIYDNESRLLYRQHDCNVVGAKEKNVMGKIKDKYVRLRSGKYKGNRSKLARYLRQKFEAHLTLQQKDELQCIANCSNIQGLIDIMEKRDVRRVLKENDILLIIKCLLRWV